MLEGSGALRVADASVLARVSRQTPQRGADVAAFARLLVQVAAASKPAAPVAVDSTGDLQEGDETPEDGSAPVVCLFPDRAANGAPALSSDARPAATAAYPRTQKAAAGAKATSPSAAPDGPVVSGPSADFGPDDLKPTPQTAVEWLDQEAFAQAAVVLGSGRTECLLRIATPDLGVVRVLVVQTRDGVNIRFVAEQELTRQALDCQLDQLYAALAKAGVGLGIMEVVGAGDPGAAAYPPELSDVSGEEPPAPGRFAARPRRAGSLPAASRLDVIV